jgi:hypothetical protein
MRVPLILLLVGLSPIGVATAHADSDGYYCIGRGYLAYQFGYDSVRNPLRALIIKTATPGAIPAPLEVRLPPSQVHAMQCGEGWVDVVGFTTVYRIALSESNRPLRYDARPLPPGGLSSFPRIANLGTLSPARTRGPQRVALGETTGGTHYVLVTTSKVIPPAEQCRVAITTRVVETDRKGTELRARVIFQGEGHLECGE